MSVTLLSLNVVNVFLHTLGCYLIVFLYKNGLKGAQQWYLINLTVCELIMNLLELLRRLCHLIHFSSHVHTYIQRVEYYLMVILFTGVTPIFYFIMTYLTVDRLLTVAFSLKYSAFWDEGRARKLAIGTWLIGAISCICVSVSDQEYQYNWKDFFFKYIFPTFEIIFSILAVVTYSKLFKKHRKSYKMSQNIRHCRSRRNAVRKVTTSLRIFWKSRFIISVNIIASFLLFRLTPTLVYLVYGILLHNHSDMLLTSCSIGYSLHNITNAFIYTFLTVSVKSLMFDRVKKFFNRNKISDASKGSWGNRINSNSIYAIR